MSIFGRVIGALTGGLPGYMLGKGIDENAGKFAKAGAKAVKTVTSNPVGASIGSVFLGIPGGFIGAKYLKF